MAYTEQPGEVRALLGKISLDGATTEQNSGYVAVGKYHRIEIVFHAVQVTTTADLDVEVAEDDAATNVHTLKSITQLDGNDDAAVVLINVRGEELGKPTGASGLNYDYLNVEVTPSGSLTGSVLIWGCEPRYAKVDQTALAEVVA